MSAFIYVYVSSCLYFGLNVVSVERARGTLRVDQTVTFATLSHAVRKMSAQVIVDSADLVFHLWPDGEIAEVTVGPGCRIDLDPDRLRGEPVTAIATSDDAPSLRRIVDDARAGRQAASARVRNSEQLSLGTTATYSAHLASDGKNIVLIGNLEDGGAQIAERLVDAEIRQSRNQSHRDPEARYEALFEAAPEGVVVVNGVTGLIEDANGRAARILGCAPHALTGTRLDTHFADVPGALDALAERELDIKLSTLNGDGCRLISRLVRSVDRTLVLVRLIGRPGGDADSDNQPTVLASHLLRQTAVPILLTDTNGEIVWANKALTVLISARDTIGKPVADLLGLSQHALAIAFREAIEHGRLLTSLGALDGQLAGGGDAHVSVVPVPSEDPRGFGFLIHTFAERKDDGSFGAVPTGGIESSALARLVGQAPMKDLVRRSTSEIERQCIEAALRLTGSNRTEAANVLGLSRQSFYLKLHQHRLI